MKYVIIGFNALVIILAALAILGVDLHGFIGFPLGAAIGHAVSQINRVLDWK